MTVALILIIIVTLLYIAYKVTQLANYLIRALPAQHNAFLFPSLNPLFSEEEIASARLISKRWESKFVYSFDRLRRTERQEKAQHLASGKPKTDFRLSRELEQLILQEAVALVGRKTTEDTVRRMIESNISILNGHAIVDVETAFRERTSKVPWENTDLNADAWKRELEISKMFEENLQQWKENLLTSWDSILEEGIPDSR